MNFGGVIILYFFFFDEFIIKFQKSYIIFLGEKLYREKGNKW